MLYPRMLWKHEARCGYVTSHLCHAFVILFDNKRCIFTLYGSKCFQLFFSTVEVYFVNNKCPVVSRNFGNCYCKFLYFCYQYSFYYSFNIVSGIPLSGQMDSCVYETSEVCLRKTRHYCGKEIKQLTTLRKRNI